MNPTGHTFNVRFNLQRGKIARVWGFAWALFNLTLQSSEFQLFVRKPAGAARDTTPQDLLWLASQIVATNGISLVSPTIFFPKPHRTSGLTVQMHSNTTTAAQGILIIYYDIDNVQIGEMVQKWEKNISKGRTRRTIAP
jgi:hypothetical protein